MNVLFLHRYGRKAAGFRYRLLQYIPFLQKEGIEFTVSSLLGDKYLEEKFDTGKRKIGPILKGFIKRLSLIFSLSKYNLVVMYGEAFPYLPAFFEAYLRCIKLPYVYDYDDAIFHKYDKSRKSIIRSLLGNKIRYILKGARSVFAGNKYLADYAKEVNQNILIVPTVVDLNRYSKIKTFNEESGSTFSIGWIGSPSTAEYLPMIAPALQSFLKNTNTKLIIVGAGPLNLDGIDFENREWSEEAEIQDLLDFDVGIMPLPDSPWARGKCGFKLIQYMACGLPVIASPVGVNTEIVEHDVNGLLASTNEEWEAAFLNFYENRRLLPQMGASAREKVEKKYSLQVMAPIVVGKLKQCMQ